LASIGLPLSLAPAQCRHHKADSRARPVTERPAASWSRMGGRMNFGWRLEPSKASRTLVSPIFGLAKRRWISLK